MSPVGTAGTLDLNEACGKLTIHDDVPRRTVGVVQERITLRWLSAPSRRSTPSWAAVGNYLRTLCNCGKLPL